MAITIEENFNRGLQWFMVWQGTSNNISHTVQLKNT